ncbi:hypothetical protein AUC68_10015 [Methyloceanibacter methanicus]|uniref:HTH cro/C1-type domain-containing protein n=1 Tax=Methyloceanibacter methanicus TaxID=1774968 RepID=A0A1E3VWH5_9HYPH|nr:helix-turn-helix transcriptional regulator [Methyloceanibacter methanicus]ODR97872.1 hypothetical protein AUC68_10015 [Methyloceanibacter methanicus]
MSKRSACETDAVVGRNIRARRLVLNMSQTALADQLGLTFQQVQKYENGTNRIGASRLLQIAQLLAAPIAALFDGTESDGDSQSALPDYLSNAQAVRLARAFADVDDTDVRRAIADVVENIAERERRKARNKQ